MFTRVEFMGPPGAGKTSLVPEVVAEFRARGVHAVELAEGVMASLHTDPRDKAFAPLLKMMPNRADSKVTKALMARSQDRMLALREFMLMNPQTMATIMQAIDARKHVDFRQDLSLGWIIELLWQYQVAARTLADADTLVLDEGFCNRALTLFGYRFSSDDEDLLGAYIDAIPYPDLVFCVSGDPEVMASRGSHTTRYGHFSREEAIAYTRDVEACATATIGFLEKRGVDVVTIHNDDASTDGAANAVRAAVRDWLTNRA